MRILLTGGLGYIGSHIAVSLIQYGHDVVILDNLSNSKIDTLDKLKRILQLEPIFIYGDVRETDLLVDIFERHEIDAVIHLAAMKSVNESFANPISYYNNNVYGAISLVKAMQQTGVRKMVYSSSAVIYGDPIHLPINESHPKNVRSPYGKTKLHSEDFLGDLANSDLSWAIVNLRYFNPVGAHSSNLIGERIDSEPSNLMPYITKVAAQELPLLKIFGSDYATKDGTCERDFIHVIDLVDAHIAAINYLDKEKGCHSFNIGTGKATSVLELVNLFEEYTLQKVPYKFANRREGDIPISLADPTLANKILGWIAKKNLQDICESCWAWQLSHRRKKN